MKKLALTAAVALLLWGTAAEAGLSSVSVELTEEVARCYLLSAMSSATDSAIREELEQQDGGFVLVSRSAGGEVSAISADAAALNRLKTGVLSRLNKALQGKTTLWVPLGSLTDIGVFNGRGPSVPVRIKLDGSANVSFQSELDSAGVNQSRHRVVMTVEAEVFSQSKRFPVRVKEQTSAVLAETVVVGEVPDVAWQAADQ